MKALVTGAGGLLGRALVAGLPAAGTWTVVGRTRAACDIADTTAVAAALDAERPDVVFNAAAFTDVDRAEDDVDGAWRGNALGPDVLARAVAARGGALVHYSTDFAFDGERERTYDEFDAPAPQGIYARSKVAGEALVAASCPRSYVVRVGCLYGNGGRNFPSTIARRLRAGETVRADRDRMGSPTWVTDVVRVSGALAASGAFGLYHCTSAGETSWADYAAFLAAELGLPAERVVAVATTSLGMKAPRPRRAVLDNRMLRLRGLDTMPDWRDAARAFLAAERG